MNSSQPQTPSQQQPQDNGLAVTCKQCPATFIISEGEQKFFVQQGLSLPKRCPACRAANKADKANAGATPPPASQVPAASQFFEHSSGGRRPTGGESSPRRNTGGGRRQERERGGGGKRNRFSEYD